MSGIHGQTLLSLAFNYGILSLQTLTFGTEELQVPVEDRPRNCMVRLNEDDKVDTVLHLLMRDFKPEEHSVNHSSSHVRFYTQPIFHVVAFPLTLFHTSSSLWQRLRELGDFKGVGHSEDEF